jgi:hypothetical protein
MERTENLKKSEKEFERNGIKKPEQRKAKRM